MIDSFICANTLTNHQIAYWLQSYCLYLRSEGNRLRAFPVTREGTLTGIAGDIQQQINHVGLVEYRVGKVVTWLLKQPESMVCPDILNPDGYELQTSFRNRVR